jgi:hypothetical protein
MYRYGAVRAQRSGSVSHRGESGCIHRLSMEWYRVQAAFNVCRRRSSLVVIRRGMRSGGVVGGIARRSRWSVIACAVTVGMVVVLLAGSLHMGEVTDHHHSYSQQCSDTTAVNGSSQRLHCIYTKYSMEGSKNKTDLFFPKHDKY